MSEDEGKTDESQTIQEKEKKREDKKMKGIETGKKEDTKRRERKD